jgi:tetratricopeptide (TPR) repeat protein
VIEYQSSPIIEMSVKPADDRSRLWFAKEYFRQNRYPEALSLIEPLLEKGDPFAISLNGEILSASGNDSLAVNAFTEAGDVISLGSLAQRSTQSGDSYVAFLANKNICEIASDSSEECIEAGKYLIDQGQYSEADGYLKLAITRDPNRRSSYLTRANALRKNGDYSDAIGVYRLALQRFPDFEQVYFEISATYYLNGQDKEAMQAIDLALETVSNPSEKNLMLAGRIYERGERFQQAISIYQKVLEINPKNQAAQKALQRLEKK